MFNVLINVIFQKENDASLETYQKALDEAAGQREIELMCLYEIGKYTENKQNCLPMSIVFVAITPDSCDL